MAQRAETLCVDAGKSFCSCRKCKVKKVERNIFCSQTFSHICGMKGSQKKDPVKIASLKVKVETLEILKQAIGETGKINAHADLAVRMYAEQLIAKNNS